MRSKLLFLIMLIAVLTALPATVFANRTVNESFEINESGSTPDDWGAWGAGVSYGGDGTKKAD